MYPWIVVAKLNSSTDPNAKLILQTEAVLNANGTVIFENLGVSVAMSNFQLEYYFKEPVGINQYAKFIIIKKNVFLNRFFFLKKN